MDMNRRIENVITNVSKAILDLLSPELPGSQLQLIHITEKFDIVVRTPFRGGIVVISNTNQF
jgi:hypothetical protein